MGAHVAAAAKKAREEIIDRLRAQHALSAPEAISLDGLSRLATRQLMRLVSDGVVRTADHDRHYLDERALRADRERQRQRGRMVLLGVLVAAFVVLAVLALVVATR